MATLGRITDVDAADAFLAAPKTLDGSLPAWGDSSWGDENVATWIILDVHGAPVAELKFTAKRANISQTAINLIYRGRPLWRIDMDASEVCHSNPHDAHLQDLDAVVCGPHEHAWPINRQHVLGQDNWDLPYRRALPPTIRRLGQGLLWLADQISLTIAPDQRGFDGPTRSDLFDGGG